MAKQLPNDIAIRVENIHKDFHLPHNNEDSIKHKIITIFEKKDKDVDTQHALRGITFDIKKGEFFGILGRNGSGKSTLLKIISEIYQPTKGSVQRYGSLVAFIELGVGFNPQLTARENVYLNAALLGFSRKEIDAFYDEVVQFAELEDHMEQKLKNYSSGMKVRLAFAVAIQAHADILVLDEVLAVGDAAFQRKCYAYFKELKDERKTIIFVSHSMSLVKEYCDRAILIEDGKIMHQGKAGDIAEEYTRLFNKPKDETAKKQTNQRWGSNELVMQRVKITTSGQKIIIETLVKNNEAAINDIVMGIDIFDRNDKLIGGTESFRYSQGILSFEDHEKKRVCYNFQNVFGGGDFSVNISVKHKTTGAVFDFWRKAASFTNTSESNTYFPVILPAELSVETIQD
jgi:ABC-2 type transport system ATP-binding protein